jgi:hypothetical protein
MTTETTAIETLEVDGLLIDAETGEVLEWPAGMTGDRFEWVKQRMIEAGAQMRRWEALGGFYKQALGRMLDQMGVKKHEGVQWVAPGPRKHLDPEKLARFMEDREIPFPVQVAAYRRIVRAVSADAFIEEFGSEESIAALIEEKPSKPYIRFDTPARAAPSIHHGERDADEG